MRYKNAQEVLPNEIIELIQQYTNGELLYIPKKINERSAWGEKSGAREQLKERNAQILKQYRSGKSLIELSSSFCLSFDSLRKIVYGKVSND